MQTLLSSSVQLPCREQREQQGVESGERREEEEEGEETKVTVHLLRQRKMQFSGVSHSRQLTHNPLKKILNSILQKCFLFNIVKNICIIRCISSIL